MVDPELIRIAGEATRSEIAITGASGFVGSHLTRALAAAGHRVHAICRNPYRAPLVDENILVHRCDINDRPGIIKIFSNCDVVFHVAALSSPWGRRDAFQRANVEGTLSVVSACVKAKVRRLVHVSSTAIYFDFIDRDGMTECTPLADPPVNAYAESKELAEKVVLEAVKQGLDAIIIRARAVFGPGDNHLLPRILAAQDQGKLKQFGGDDVRTDLTYIDNLVSALVRGIDHGGPGDAFIVTQDEPVELWPFLREVMRRTGRSGRLPRVSRKLALTAARLLEAKQLLLNPRCEPAVTRYGVGLLSTTKTFRIDAAKTRLGYRPHVSMAEAVDRTVNHLRHLQEGHAEAWVSIRLFTTGYTWAREAFVIPGGSWRKVVRFHSLVALLDHPREGLTLFDTGYSPRFLEETRRLPFRLMRRTTPVLTHPGLSVRALLLDAGVDPGRIRRIFISHFHADHCCGLADFPDADVVASEDAWKAVRDLRGLSAVRRAVIPALFPRDIESRLFTISAFHGPGIGDFQSTHDLFGDGSVRVIPLPGHADGQCGLLLQVGKDERCLFAADASWTRSCLELDRRPTRAFSMIASDRKAMRLSRSKLANLMKTHPDVKVIPTHCPRVASEHGFDEVVDAFAQDGKVSGAIEK